MQHRTLLACALLVLVVLSSLPSCTAAEAVCDPTPFVPFQGMSGTIERCSNCLFPTYPYASSINVTAYPPMDFSDTWMYFLGDVTVRQIYGEFAAIVHNAQVRHLSPCSRMKSCKVPWSCSQLAQSMHTHAQGTHGMECSQGLGRRLAGNTVHF